MKKEYVKPVIAVCSIEPETMIAESVQFGDPNKPLSTKDRSYDEGYYDQGSSSNKDLW